LQESVAAFELFVLVLYDFDAIDNLHETGLKHFGLSEILVSRMFIVLKGPGVIAETVRSDDDVEVIECARRRL
jgi:hypothetical protein